MEAVYTSPVSTNSKSKVPRSATWKYGLTLVHFSAHPEPLFEPEAKASVHLSAQPETFLPVEPPNIANKVG
jgi:hypothetical protein